MNTRPEMHADRGPAGTDGRADEHREGPSERTRPAPRLVWRTAPRVVVVVLAVALLELLLHFVFARRAPRPEDWGKARAAVQAWYRPGDLVAIAPYWAEPMARWKFGSDLMPMKDVARPDASRYPHAIEVSAMGSRDPELAGWVQEQKTSVGPLVIRRLRQPTPPDVRYVFTDHLEPDRAEAFLDQSGRVTPCPYTTSAGVQTGGLSGNPTFPSSRFACGSARSDQFAGITIIDDEQFRPRRCIWMHAPGGQPEMGIRFSNVPLGQVIHGHTGAHWMFERDATSAFSVRVLVDGEEIGRVLHQDQTGWTPFRLVIPSSHAGQTANVEFRVGSYGSHPVCLEADTR